MPRAVHVKAGTVLFRTGEPGDVAYFIDSGLLQIQTHPGPDAVILAQHGKGQLIGEMAIIDGGPRSATVIAAEDSVLYPVSRDQIASRLKTVDPVIRACLETVLVRFRATMRTLSELQAKQAATPHDSRSDAPSAAALRQAVESLKLETEIRSGIERGEFVVHYQPIIALDTGDLHGFEALMRWEHPRLGRLGPQHFIPVAESAGLMPELTAWLVDAAIEGLLTIDLGLAVPHTSARAPRLSINVSAIDLAEDRLVTHLRARLRAHEVPPARLTVEVTETALMTNTEQAVAQLQILRDLGCGVAIDDFGTGYANLSYVRTLPASSLKLDRSFTAAMTEDALTRRLVDSVLTLGRDLNMAVVAEGLELSEDMVLLRQMGCPYGQGFGIARPADQVHMAAWARRWQKGERPAPFKDAAGLAGPMERTNRAQISTLKEDQLS